MKKRINDKLANNIIFIILAVGLFLILINNLFYESKFISETYNKSAIPNLVLLPISLLLFGIFIYFYKFKKSPKLTRLSLSNINMNRAIYIFSIIVLLYQLFLFYNIFFAMDWDVGTVTQTAIDISKSGIVVDPTYDRYWYYSLFPNNIFITALFSVLIDFGAKLGIGPYHFLSIISILLVNITGILLYKNSYKLLKDKNISFVVWLLYTFLISFSTWALVPYSDTFSILFTNLGLYLYLNRDKISPYINAVLIPIILYIGMLIKPTVIILLIGIVIVQGWQWLFVPKKVKLKQLVLIPLAICSLFLGTLVKGASWDKLGFSGNKDQEIPFTHFLMMGLNMKDNGAFSYDDYNYTRSFETYEKKVEMNKSVIKQRLTEPSISELVSFFQSKSLMNFNDGSFALGSEENSFNRVSEEKIPILSSLMRSFKYPDGNHFNLTMIWLKLLWGFVLCMGFFSFPYLWTKKSNDLAVVSVTLIGICIFVTLFEGRGRYLILYTPYFLILCGLGMKVYITKLSKLMKSIDSKYKKKQETMNELNIEDNERL